MDAKERIHMSLAEKIERFEDVVRVPVSSFASKEGFFEESIKNACIGYKQVLEQDRNSILALKEFIGQSKPTDVHLDDYRLYLSYIQNRFKENCGAFIENLKAVDSVVSKEGHPGMKLQLLKTLGDYHRYLIEVAAEPKDAKAVKKAEDYYRKAADLLSADKEKISIVAQLAFKLNYAVFEYELLNNKQEAVQSLMLAFEEGLAVLENFKDDESLKDLTHVLNTIDRTVHDWKDGSSHDL